MAGSFIHSILTADTDVQALVNGRVYPMRATQKAQSPYVTYLEIDSDPTNTDNGVSPLDTDTYQVNCFGENYEASFQLYEKVRAALDGYSGTVDTTKIGYCRYEDRNAVYDEDGKRAGIAVDFEFDIER